MKKKPSLMMAGATMKITTDSQQGQAVGSWIRLEGRILWIAPSVEEVHRLPGLVRDAHGQGSGECFLRNGAGLQGLRRAEYGCRLVGS